MFGRPTLFHTGGRTVELNFAFLVPLHDRGGRRSHLVTARALGQFFARLQRSTGRTEGSRRLHSKGDFAGRSGTPSGFCVTHLFVGADARRTAKVKLRSIECESLTRARVAVAIKAAAFAAVHGELPLVPPCYETCVAAEFV